MFIQII